MLVFHFLANFLKDESLFDNDVEESLSTGAVYNDFDSCPMDTLLTQEETESFSFSQPTGISSRPINENENEAIESALDNAVMEADKHEGVLYEHLQWDSPYFDNASEACDSEYCKKVHALATNHENAWSDIKISPQAVSMFQRRLRTSWSAPDTVFDAWLLRRGGERSWFDSHLFSVLFPDFECDNFDEESLALSSPQCRSTPITQGSITYPAVSDSDNEGPPKKRSRINTSHLGKSKLKSSEGSNSNGEFSSSSSDLDQSLENDEEWNNAQKRSSSSLVKTEPGTPPKFNPPVRIEEVVEISDSDKESTPITVKKEHVYFSLFDAPVYIEEVLVISDSDDEAE